MSNHGYGAYTRGCRCDVCREAKASYMRGKRHDASAQAAAHTNAVKPYCTRIGLLRFVAPSVTHGLASSYKDAGCRCWPCTEAATVKSVAEKQRRRARRQVSA